MTNFETPIQFDIQKTLGDVQIEFADLMEITQGGAEVGTLLVNGQPISEYRFGGPILYENGFVYAPMFIRRLCVVGFKLSRINMGSRKIEPIGQIKPVIFLDRIDDGKIYFFGDLQKSVVFHYNLEHL